MIGRRQRTACASLLSESVGELLLLWVVQRAFSSARNAKEECRAYQKKLEKKTEKMSIKNRFIATLTHEMRNFVSV